MLMLMVVQLCDLLVEPVMVAFFAVWNYWHPFLILKLNIIICINNEIVYIYKYKEVD